MIRKSLRTKIKPSEGSRWFRRFMKDCQRISPHIKIVRLKLGFYRIYYNEAYIAEFYKEMPEHGYDMTCVDPRLESRQYYQEYEDTVELTRNIKNFVEGYWEIMDTVKTRVYLMKHNKEYNKSARQAYKNMYIK